MGRAVAVSMCLTTLAVIASLAPLSVADTVIESDRIELLEAGSFEDANDWIITTRAAFSEDPADHSGGMVADGELSFTHNRPDNFQTHTAWATYSVTDSNYSLGMPDGSYTWSKGPDITVSGYSFTGLDTRILANVSMILYISVPDALTSDEIRITIEANGPERLVKTIARTFGPLNRMTTPLVVNIDNLQTWAWSDLADSSVTVDYVSDGAPDDSEVRVDAVGIRVKYHQPWYSFETVKAIHEIASQNMPVLDFGPYDGQVSGLVAESCGLTPEEGTQGLWTFDVEVPYDQELGRIHVFGEGNFTIEAMPQGQTSIENYQAYQNGQLLADRGTTNSVRITIYDGCISMARVDVNDPHMVVVGSIAGSVSGLAEEYSNIRFAIGDVLLNEVAIEVGDFSFQVPIGNALPNHGDSLEVGIASRFQWSSNGVAETTVVHIESISIDGGYNLVWDLDVTCSSPSRQELVEDGGGVLIAMASRCEDDLTAWDDLEVRAWTEADDLLSVSALSGDIRIQPLPDTSGEAVVNVEVIDESGNTWQGKFTVNVLEVEDAPRIEGLPVLTYINLGETKVIDIEISDPDSSELSISTSRSWANIDSAGDLIMTPVEPGTHTVEITVSDGIFTEAKSLEVIVTAQPDLTIENLEIWKGNIAIDSVEEGDVVQLKVYVRNQGRGIANTIDVRCWVDGMLVGSTILENVAPGGLSIATCDTQIVTSGTIIIRGMVDSTASIEESNEENNEVLISVESEGRDNGANDDSIDRGPAIIVTSVGLIAISIAALQLGPGRLRKPYRKR
ncbi:MAG: CARDB domain-containing protein [Candidatus Thermoplasmatota archaeon]|nr:CARDB domain-containing protein [Candidatus Thermoplasmatota archaeon]MEC8954381.1 CARDB domain-containing protein [Candidatus Thermoplasmatota archaeon]MEE3201575.1 CARDB domain-containing protein [Candidatus Thermoplasmatota archaeon]